MVPFQDYLAMTALCTLNFHISYLSLLSSVQVVSLFL